MAERLLIFKCLLISPGDVKEERDSLYQCVDSWNAHTGRALNVRVELVGWETHCTPEMGEEPQVIVNRQIVEDCDFGCAIFWSRLGTATSKHLSGSIEEIENLLKRNKKVSIYFKTADLPQKTLDTNQYNELQKIRKEYSSKGLIAEFGTKEELQKQFQLHLTSIVEGIIKENKTSETEDDEILTAPKPDVRVSLSSNIVVGGSGYTGENRFLTADIKNYSPNVVYISGIMIEKYDGGAIWPTRDGYNGNYNPTRVELKPGDNYLFNFHPDVFNKKVNPQVEIKQLTRVVVSDAIGRHYYTSEEDFKNKLQDFLKE